MRQPRLQFAKVRMIVAAHNVNIWSRSNRWNALDVPIRVVRPNATSLHQLIEHEGEVCSGVTSFPASDMTVEQKLSTRNSAHPEMATCGHDSE